MCERRQGTCIFNTAKNDNTKHTAKKFLIYKNVTYPRRKN